MRKREYYQNIDLYLDDELTGDELNAFNVELLINSGLSEEVELHREVQRSVQEIDIMNLRNRLGAIMGEQYMEDQLSEEVVSAHMSYNFGLSNEFASLKEFFKPLGSGDLNSLSHSLPRIHLFQHGIAAKENIHHFYREQQEESVSEDELLSPSDEAIFSELREALHERDITELRANLGQIAAGMPDHQRSDEEIDRYLNHDLKPAQLLRFEEELAYNQWLSKDIDLHKEVDSALQETDVMELRASLDKIQGIEHSVTGRVEEIDRYLFDEMNAEEMSLFVEELSSNSALSSEVTMYREVDTALEERDIMKLRSNLESLGKEIVKDRQRSIRMPLSKIAIASIAASLALILSIGGIMTRQATTDTDLYGQYYQSYETTGIVRSGNATMDNTLTVALQKFNAQEYESALELFQQVIAYDSRNPVGHFYSGVSYQETGRFNKAIEEYELVIKDKDNLFVEQSEWYIGLCYLQTQDRKKAYRHLERISKSNSYYSKKADAIIRKLKFIE